jgi:hypothetical protein
MLKKLLSVFVTVAVATSFAQQVPNSGLETWIPQSGPPSYEDPTGWGTPNVLSNALLGGNPISVTKATSPNINAGTYAMKIVTFKYTPGFANITAYLPNDTLGFALTGSVDATSPYLHPGYQETTRYAQLDFYAKYVPVGSDQGTCAVYLKKWTGPGAKVDTIATGAIVIASNASFAKLTVPLVYKKGTAPDTAVIIFSSSFTKPQVGSALWIDDVSFSGIVAGLNERNMLMNAIKVFPNPATDKITFAAHMNNESLSQVEVFDATGRQVEGIVVENNRTELNTNAYSEGLYMYNAYNDKKELIGIGKFNVVK